jgi:hypothetical protein
MGLDMYLTRKKYIGAKYDFNKVTGIVDIKIGDVPVPIDFNKITYIDEEVGYWRKANAIHNWFVDHVQEGIDDCKEYYVDFETLEELLGICKQVQENHSLAEELLPTTEGFFFGGIEYDKDYFYDIQRTIDILTKVIEEEEEYNKNKFYSEFTYQSSW